MAEFYCVSPMGDGVCECVCGYGFVGKAIDSGVVLTTAGAHPRTETDRASAHTAADTQS